MIVHSYTAIHYGVDYVGWALKSVIDNVDVAHIIYTPSPSHGHQADVECPESRDDIWKVTDIGTNKIRRYEMSYGNEGQQRDWAVAQCVRAKAELILVVDCDEIWQPDILKEALDHVWQQNSARNWLINFTHLWRSFNHCCRDENWPVRIIDLRHSEGIGYIPKELGEIYHFGYAVRGSLMQYKWLIHGHKDELRSNWFEEKWNSQVLPVDCHPANERGFWNAQLFDKRRLPEFMREHPFYSLERIE